MAGNLESRISELETELEDTHRRLTYTRRWCLERLQRIKVWADTLPTEHRDRYYELLAADSPEP